ncbi:hypothetical protein VKT23_016011 [Stygiomarasmius scandens]|uniref:AB hydrolase-1 domain-containing protein n=1 Tax=Marasmiellus scandens TaxID=2682957 RepID=A0ABR1IZI6_9AGAR
MVKLPAKVEGAEYGGPIFTNPGGPGGSGVGDILTSGKVYQNMTGTQFDIIGFDPRDVNMTTPTVSAFETAEEGRAFAPDVIGDLNSTADALSLAWASYQSYGQAAQSRDVNGTLNFVSTADVARDMLAMMNALGQDKLQYYGISYGTYLGQVFATMFPDRVGRMVIDGKKFTQSLIDQVIEIIHAGVVDSEAYLASDWGTLTQDMDKLMQAFFESCHSVGPELCPFYASTPSEIASNLDAIYDSLRVQPLPVLSGDTVAVFTYDNLRSIIWESTVSPFTGFPTIASILAQLSQGNATGLATDTPISDDIVNQGEAFTAIHCSDANPLNSSASELREYMSSVNSSFAGVATAARARCT